MKGSRNPSDNPSMIRKFKIFTLKTKLDKHEVKENKNETNEHKQERLSLHLRRPNNLMLPERHTEEINLL